MDIVEGRLKDLPDFRNPPLAETVLSLQFEPIAGLTSAHLGLLWQRFRERLPLIEEQPPLPPMLETFGPPSPARVEVTVEEKPPVPRLWFLNQDKTELIQVQADRFIHNWRKMEGMAPYPRFEAIRDKFRGEVATLGKFLEDEEMRSPIVNQCEVTYVNHIEPSGVWERHGQIDKVLAGWAATPERRFLPEAEDGGVRLRFVMRDDGGKPMGRLHVMSQAAWKKADNAPILILNLTARGEPAGEGIEGAFRFFEIGRRWIVKGFAELTTTQMHKAWERIDG